MRHCGLMLELAGRAAPAGKRPPVAQHSAVSHDGSSFGGIQLLSRRGYAKRGSGCNVKPFEFIKLPEGLIEYSGCDRLSTAFASGNQRPLLGLKIVCSKFRFVVEICQRQASGECRLRV